MTVQNNGFLSMEQITDQYLKQQGNNPLEKKTSELSFQKILDQKTEESKTEEVTDLKFSRHATIRLQDRNIELTAEQVERLSDGTRKAGLKGIKDSLVIVDQLAFIVNVPNSTVITAMDSTDTYDNIFTNIDGAVII